MIYLLASYQPIEELESMVESAPATHPEDIVSRLNQMAATTRGVKIEPDGRQTSTTFSSGKSVEVKMNAAAGKAEAVTVIQFNHQPAVMLDAP